MRGARALRRHWPIAAVALCAGCGPSNASVGVAVLVLAPLAYAAAVLPSLLLRRLREGPRSRPASDLRPAWVGFGLSWLFPAIGLAIGATTTWGDEILAPAAFVVSSAGMLYGQIGWLAADRGQERFGRFAFPTLLLVQWLPALVFAFDGPLGLGLSHDAGQSFALFVWVLPGYFFAPPVVLFLIAAGFFVHARRRADRLRG